MDSLSSQMERLLSMQQSVLVRLDGLSLDVRGIGRDLASMHEEDHGGRRGSGVHAACRELHGTVERASEQMESQGRRLDGVERLVEGTQQVICFIGEVVKSSRLVELLFKQPGKKANKKVRDLTTSQARFSSKKWPQNAGFFSSSGLFSSPAQSTLRKVQRHVLIVVLLLCAVST